jgi:hypothetical protein
MIIRLKKEKSWYQTLNIEFKKKRNMSKTSLKQLIARSIIFGIFFCILGVKLATSQVSVNIKGGLNITSLLTSYHGEENKSKAGINIGISSEIPLIGPLGVDVGLIFTSKGYRSVYTDVYYNENWWQYDTTTIKSNININYLELPVRATGTLKLGNAKLVGSFGPYFGLGVGGKISTDETTNGNTVSYTDFMKFGNDPENSYLKRFDCGLSFGLGLNSKHFHMGISYDLGLRNLEPASDGGNMLKNRAWSIDMGYRFDCASLNSEDYKARIKAVNKTQKQEKLFGIVLEDKDWRVRQAAVYKITDQNILYKVVLNDDNYEVGIAAMNKITDQNILNMVVLEDVNFQLKLLAIKRITDQNVFYKVARDDKNYEVRIAAMNKLTPGLLVQLLTVVNEFDLKIEIIDMLNDQTELLKIAQNNDIWEVRKAAFKKLNDNSLDVLSREAKDPALSLSAKIRLGRVSWNEAFSVRNSTDGTLNNVIGAAAIVDSPQPTAYDVVLACHNFIQLGDASRIPELIFLLNKFGDVTLAEDYMNCGESTLYDAGCQWGRAHGYTCTTGNGSSRVRWGSKK